MKWLFYLKLRIDHIPLLRSNQSNQTKEPVLEVNVESESVNSEKVNLKEESSESDLSEPSHSPQQSRFQHIFTNSETQNSTYGSGFENRFSVPINSQASDESLRNSFSMREDPTAKSLLSDPFINNSAELQILQQHFNVDIQQGISSQSNHIHKSFSSSDIDVLNSKNSVRCPSIPSPFSSNGTSSSLSEKVEDLKLDDDLGFDPCQLSLDALQKITAEEKVNSQRAAPVRNVFNSTLKQPAAYNGCSSFTLQQVKNLQQHPQNYMSRHRNPPPPGFGANAFSSSQQPLASPGYEPRNVTSNRMSPVVNLPNYNGIMRPNFPFQRYQSLSNNSVANGFTPQQIRTVPPAQTFHDFPSRSAPTSQHMPSQRLENMPLLPQQHFATQEQNLSPSSFMNMNQQSQWIQNFENYQSPTASKSHRKGVDGFSVETPGLLTDPVPISPSSDSLTDAWYPLCTNFVITKPFVDYVMNSFFPYRQFNSNFTCGDPMILPYELIHSRNCGTVGHNVPRVWQVLDVYASHLVTRTPPEYGAPCETVLSVHLFHPAINL
ncbi:hypothetical protein AVEN_110232-1 [Araneus ventricosus]|uniref:Uncharacterized protein n=1 Tax=Araneus ventricosus TaxID=182803 RepID=A0A4Y2QT77_ARAVE|nr:hypothetical protein AVEN_110232-1 [Araneus ventricosus]